MRHIPSSTLVQAATACQLCTATASTEDSQLIKMKGCLEASGQGRLALLLEPIEALFQGPKVSIIWPHRVTSFLSDRTDPCDWFIAHIVVYPKASSFRDTAHGSRHVTCGNSAWNECPLHTGLMSLLGALVQFHWHRMKSIVKNKHWGQVKLGELEIDISLMTIPASSAQVVPPLGGNREAGLPALKARLLCP